MDVSILLRMEIESQLQPFLGHDQLALVMERYSSKKPEQSASQTQTNKLDLDVLSMQNRFESDVLPRQSRFESDVLPTQNRPTLIFTHGFGQNRLSWRNSANKLARSGYQCLSLDARGHGDSAWSSSGAYELDDFVWDLLKLGQKLALADGVKPVLIGASMGGLVGMLAECEARAQDAGAFSALVMIDVTPRWENAGVSRIFEFMRAHPDGFTDIHHAAAAVSKYLPHRDAQDPERLRGHLRLGADHRLRWHWDPLLLEHIPKASERYQARLEAAASLVRCPVLLLSGAKSDVVSERTINHFLSLVPQAEHQQIADATHMVVGDRNDIFCQAIASYLGKLEPLVQTSPQ
jgi:pimeloyl-ACP methyl ester carboxylesterase